jgi:hypothetical protein
MSNEVKPYTDEELDRIEVILTQLELGAVTIDPLRFLATIQEDRRKLAIAEKALRSLRRYAPQGVCPKDQGHVCMETIIRDALAAITTTNPPSDA